jgi:hypothetical protein
MARSFIKFDFPTDRNNPTDGEIPNSKQQIPKPRMIMIRGWFGIWGLRIENYLGFVI